VQRVKAATALLAVVFSLTLVVGCGGDDEAANSDATVEWAEGFCGAVSTWTDELERLQDMFDDPASLSVDAIQDAAEDANAATETFLDEVRALGRPETDVGEEIESSVESLTDTIETEKAEVEEAIEDADGITGATSALATIGTSLSAMATAFQETVTLLRGSDASEELQDAFEQADACDELND
jgi:hypothetical protein